MWVVPPSLSYPVLPSVLLFLVPYCPTAFSLLPSFLFPPVSPPVLCSLPICSGFIFCLFTRSSKTWLRNLVTAAASFVILWLSSPCGFADPISFRLLSSCWKLKCISSGPKSWFVPFPFFLLPSFLSRTLLRLSPTSDALSVFGCADPDSSLGHHTRVAQALSYPFGSMHIHCTAIS